MNLLEAIKTNKFVKRKHWESQGFCYFLANSGPYKELVDCDYFCFYEDGFLTFSTTGPDLYAEEILAEDYELFLISEEDVNNAYQETEKTK